ncbi:MAG: DedA family protein [Planctomycetota bacterium]|jgi:membrane protein DedA with SNARE-associated domain
MEQFIQTYLHLYGPLAVFLLLMLSGVGIPLGEDIITIPAGLLVVGSDQFNFWPTVIATYLGVVCSDVLWFTICRHYGTPLLHKRWVKRLLHPRRLLEAKHQFQQRGTWLIVMARFIPSSRTTTITIAGMLHMPFWKFTLATASCVVITAPLQIGLGMLVASGIGTLDTPKLVMSVLGLMMVIIATMLFIGWYSAHRRAKKRAPRARASWLRRHRPRRRRRDALPGLATDEADAAMRPAVDPHADLVAGTVGPASATESQPPAGSATG